MSTYALVGPDNQIDRVAGDIDPTTGTKPGWRWLVYEEIEAKFDPATQVKEPPGITITAEKVTKTHVVRDMTTRELEAARLARATEFVQSPRNRIMRRLVEVATGKTIT